MSEPNHHFALNSILKECVCAEVHLYYKRILDQAPGYMYWLDKDCITQGCNQNMLSLCGLNSSKQFEGLNYQVVSQLANWTP